MKSIVYADRKAADPWIVLKHRGINEGVGLVPWSGQVSAEYDRRRGKTSVALQLIEFSEKYVSLDPKTKAKIDAGKFPVTTLNRLVNTKYVYEKLGFRKDKGALYTAHSSKGLVDPIKKNNG